MAMREEALIRELLANVDAIRSIPGVIVQGRYDVVCPMESGRGPQSTRTCNWNSS